MKATQISHWTVYDEPSSNGYYQVIDEGTWSIAYVRNRREALLVAAAPELLEVLNDTLAYFNVCDQNAIPLDLKKQIKKALNKTKGL